MSRNREILEQAIETGEADRGSVEFKERLIRSVHLVDDKRESLVAQLRHRVLSGDGEATYVVGVTDDGEITGITPDAFSETLDVLSILADEADARIAEVQTWSSDEAGDAAGLVGVATIREASENDIEIDLDHIVVGTAGHVDHGKSTLVGSLVTGSPDDGEGGTRSYLDVQPHEVERGLSADLSYAVYGFADDEPMRLDNPTRRDERSGVVADADRLISFVDTVGHEPWLKTAIRGLVGQRLDYGLLAVAADDGPTKITREHLGVLLAMELPTIIAITKTDTVDEQRVREVEGEVERLIRNVNCSPISVERTGLDAAIEEISSSVLPIVRTSAVTMDGLEQLDALFNRLPKTQHEAGDFCMYLDTTYTVSGVGTVVSGTVKSGAVSVGDELLLGPFPDGSFRKTKARSIEIHYHSVEKAVSGQLASIALKGVSEDEIHRGMTLVPYGADPTPVREFEAELVVLNHPTRITDGYEPVVHLETISEVAMITPDEERLLPGDDGTATFRFKFNPYLVEEGQRFVFREGQSKGVGTVTDITTSD